MTYYWQADKTPPDLIYALKIISAHYPGLSQDATAGVPIVFERIPDLAGPLVQLEADRVLINYGATTHALRGLGTLLSDLVRPGIPLRETIPFSPLGIMLDCSRNAVMTPEHIRRWMTQLAMLGYNGIMLYTEDTYALPGEPYFGYLRGRYTEAELRGLDEHAAALGMELIGCIQTLGHLEHLLKWSCYREVMDTSRVLMVDHERTYELIDAMIALYARTYRSRRIHIGMDETHDLGRGRFMDKNGYERGYALFQRHLDRVNVICKKHGLQPILWSDMYFRMGNATQDYYDPGTQIPEEVKSSIPDNVQLVYWDYYHEDQAFYEDWIRRHFDLGQAPVMASGIWTWAGLFWHDQETTMKTAVPCIEACRATGVKELFFTLWCDDGAYCEYDSALAGVAFAAECAIKGRSNIDENSLALRFRALIGSDYKAVCEASDIQKLIWPAILFWDDPLLGIYWKNESLKSPDKWARVARQYDRLLRSLARFKEEQSPIDFAHWHTLTSYLLRVVRFKLALDETYAVRDMDQLARLEKRARLMPRELEKCNQSFRRQWFRRNRPNGFETIQNRIGARKQRWLELAQRIGELRCGDVAAIPELEEKAPLPVDVQARWLSVASSGIV